MHRISEVFHGCRTCEREKDGQSHAVCPEHLRVVRQDKRIVTKLGVDFDYTFVDLLEGKEQDDAMNEVEKWNPKDRSRRW